MRLHLTCLIALLISLSASAAEEVTSSSTESRIAAIDESALAPKSVTQDTLQAEAIERYDYWQLLLDGFALPPLNTSAINEYSQLYSSNLSWVMQSLQRGAPYLGNIINTVRLRGMPGEIALLPVIESGFNASALSPASAAGIWQFIPETGTRFGLKQSWLRDERRDPLTATDAALNYLQALYQQFGDWHLALAAYNCGENCVERARQKALQLHRSTDFTGIAPFLPMETRAYVPRLLAVSLLIKSYSGRTYLLPSIPSSLAIVGITLDQPSDLDTLARLASTRYNDLAVLNAGVSRQYIPPGSLIWMPNEALARLRSALEKAENKQAELVLSLKAVKAQPGETLTAFAERVAQPIEEIRRINNISPMLNKIATGTLFIKRQTDEQSPVVEPGLLEPLKMVGETMYSSTRQAKVNTLLLAHHPEMVSAGWLPGRLSLQSRSRRR